MVFALMWYEAISLQKRNCNQRQGQKGNNLRRGILPEILYQRVFDVAAK